MSGGLQGVDTLCRFDHHRLHDRAFRIVADHGCELRFETADGTPIGSSLGGTETLTEASGAAVAARARPAP